MTLECFEQRLPHGITLSCRAAGDAARRPRIVLLHGFPEAAFAWDDVLEAMSGEARCVAPNLRGYERSSAPTDFEAYRARHLIGDVAALIESMGAPLDLLVAHDWGGALAWGLAAARPQLIRRLLIVNAPHPATFLRELRTNPAQQAASAYMLQLARPDAEQHLLADDCAMLWRSLQQGDATWLSPAWRARYREVWAMGLRGPAAYYRASPLRPPQSASDPVHALQLPPEATRVEVPTRVLWGEQDHALLPALLDGLGEHVPRLHVERVPDAGHWIVHQQPQRVLQAIRSALADAA